MKKIILLTLLALVSFACKKQNVENKLKAMDWLLGSWENKSELGYLQENWTKINDSIYQGSTYFIKEKDTLHNEQITLEQKEGKVRYVPTVKGQNNDQPVVFLLTSQTAKQFVFENPNHDYPKKIIYNMINSDSLVAVISGVQEGKASSESFAIKKSK